MNQSLTDPNRMLLLGAYSMEVVECGGALLKNSQQGGISHAAIAFAGADMRKDLLKSAEFLQTTVEFLDFDIGAISASYDEKIKLIQVIRRFRPNIILTQDPEHCVNDLDPGRRPFMTLVLESIALASRDYALDVLPELKPCPIPTIYFMTPDHPNCVIDLFDVWEQKCSAMDALKSQLEYFGKPASGDSDSLAKYRSWIPEWDHLETDLARGMFLKRKMDESFYRYPYSTGHCRAMYAEPYRRSDCFVLDQLFS